MSRDVRAKGAEAPFEVADATKASGRALPSVPGAASSAGEAEPEEAESRRLRDRGEARHCVVGREVRDG